MLWYIKCFAVLFTELIFLNKEVIKRSDEITIFLCVHCLCVMWSSGTDEHMLCSKSSAFTRPMEVLQHAVRTREIKCVSHLQGKWTDKRWSLARTYVIPVLIQNGLLGAEPATVVGRCHFYGTTLIPLLSKNQSSYCRLILKIQIFFLIALLFTVGWGKKKKKSTHSPLLLRFHFLNGI